MKFIETLKRAYLTHELKFPFEEASNIPSTTAVPNTIGTAKDADAAISNEIESLKKISSIAKETGNKDLEKKQTELSDLYKQIADALKMKATRALNSIQ